MRLIDADALIKVLEEQDHYLWSLPDEENPHKRAKQGELNWCINTIREQPTVNVEAVLCKDCCFYRSSKTTTKGICSLHGSRCYEADFCSWGITKRRI